MKMAAAEALDNTGHNVACLSLFVDRRASRATRRRLHRASSASPTWLSLLATLNPNGTVKGINVRSTRLSSRSTARVTTSRSSAWTYWTFGLMIGAGMLMTLIALAGLALMRRRWPRVAEVVLTGHAAGGVLADPG
jgi:cytochrome d ubiquinol oxidase subunit I